jgi:hypothetical protein
LAIGFKRPLEDEDLPFLPPGYRGDEIQQDFDRIWEEEKQKQK